MHYKSVFSISVCTLYSNMAFLILAMIPGYLLNLLLNTKATTLMSEECMCLKKKNKPNS